MNKDDITSLPKIMAERAIWARNEFIKNPQKSQFDDDVLIWCFNKEDNLWYSILGNYSYSSPEEKRIKEANRNAEYENRMQTAKEMAEWHYQNVLYQTNIRKKVFERDNWTCQICEKIGDTKFHIHHIHKRVEGGNDCLDNLMVVCPNCHKKADTQLYNPIWK